MNRRTRPLALLAIVLCGLSVEAQQPERSEEPRLEGSLYWIFSRQYDLAGEVSLWTPLPFRTSFHPAFNLTAQTAISRASELKFVVRSLNYRAELSADLAGSRAWGVVLGQRGQEGVDREREAWVRYLAASWHPEGSWHDLSGSVLVGGVVAHSEIRADLYLRGDVAWIWNGARWDFGAEATLDALDGSDGWRSEWTVGPIWWFPWGDRGKAQLFARWRDGDNPLGLETSGAEVGFKFLGAGGALGGAHPEAEIRGSVGAGVGEQGRLSARLDARFLAPPWRGTNLFIELDSNIQTAAETGDLFYFLWLGAQRPIAGLEAVAQINHRSDHRLAEPGMVKSFNALELGMQSREWRRPLRDAGEFAASLYLGYLIESDFGEDRRLSLRGGARRAHQHRWGEWLPYVAAELEWSDAGRWNLAFGAVTRRHFDLALNLSRDSQWFAVDKTVLALKGSIQF